MFVTVESRILCHDTLAPDNERFARDAAVYAAAFLGRIEASRLPTASGYWCMMFPDHCVPTNIFYAAVKHLPVEDVYVPAVLVACEHWEYGDKVEDLRRLHTLAEIIALEAFNTERFDTNIVTVSGDRLAMMVYPLDCCARENLDEAIRRTATLLLNKKTPPWIW